MRSPTYRDEPGSKDEPTPQKEISDMPSPDRTLEEILNLAAAHFKVPREKLRPDDDFFKTLGIDSLQTLDLLTKLENHFHVELPDYELQGVSDFRTLANKIRTRL
jgi:acyl carrier protein